MGVAVWICCLDLGLGQEPQVDASQMPRIAATEPEEVLGTFEIREGFSLKLAAHEPDVVDPIAMVFDADGGMYVIEMRGYSERREDRLGRIRYLEDKDNDGIFESSTIFKDGLKWPTGIVCYKGGVFVGVTPDLIYLKDEDGDRVADREGVVFTGFGPENSRLNMQALFNSFHWGPDNRIWGAAAASGGRVTRPGSSEPPIVLRRADFSFDPEKLDFRLENGTAQYGMSFDSQGHRFVCSNSRHVIWVAYERSDVIPNPYFNLPSALTDIADDGAAAPGAGPNGVLQRWWRERFQRFGRLSEFEHSRASFAQHSARGSVDAARRKHIGARRVDGHLNAILVGADPGRLAALVHGPMHVLEHEAGRRFHGHDQHRGRL